MIGEDHAWEVMHALEHGVEAQTRRVVDADELAGYARAARLLRAVTRMRDGGRSIENAIQAIEFIAANPGSRTVLKLNGDTVEPDKEKDGNE